MMRRIKKYRKLIAIFSGVFLLWLIIKLVVVLTLGNVSYQLTFQTDYQKMEDDSFVISTSWAEIPTQKRFINVATKPTCPGYLGSFIVPDFNFIDYEYGYYTSELSTFVAEGYKWQTDSLNGRIIHAVYKGDEMGFIIPRQNDMSYNFVLYPSRYGAEHRKELTNTLAVVKFKKK